MASREKTAVISLVLLLAGLAASCVRMRTRSPEARAYYDQSAKGEQLKRSGQYDEAVAVFRAQLTLAPGNPSPDYDIARTLALKGDSAGAIAALQAFEASGGWTPAERLREDEELKGLRGDDAFEALAGRMEARREAALQTNSKPSPEREPASAPAFGSLSDLQREFDGRERALDRDSWQRNPWKLDDEKRAITEGRIAAIRRYLDDHPDDPRRDEAGSALVEATSALHGVDWMFEPWGGDAHRALEADEWFLRTFPQSGHRARVLYLKALHTWYARAGNEALPLDQTTPPVSRDEVAAVLPLLDDVTARYPQTPEGGKALAWRMGFAWEAAGRQADPEVRELHARLEKEYGGDPSVMEYARSTFRDVFAALRGVGDFQGTDLDGRSWNAETMKGKVVLIEFWASWCGPCVGEIPSLKKAFATYHDRGFDIVGVSLDEGGVEDFREWLKTHDIPWPQIYDGRGWRGELARRYDVRAIPHSILLDREGRIVGVDLRGKEVGERVGPLCDRPAKNS